MTMPLDIPHWESEMVWAQKTANAPLGRFVIAAIQNMDWQEPEAL